MAKREERTATPAFYEVLLEGSPKVASGFLAGLALGAGIEAQVYYCHEDAIGEEEGLGERLAELLARQPRDCRVVVDGGLRELLRRLGARLGRQTGLELASIRRVRSAELPFRYEAFARRYAEQIERKLGELPAGVKVLDHERQESVDPEAAGLEAYSPAHDYEIKGQGRIVGRVDLVVEARRALAEHPLIKVDRIALTYA